jgi:hypothetical protein
MAAPGHSHQPRPATTHSSREPRANATGFAPGVDCGRRGAALPAAGGYEKPKVVGSYQDAVMSTLAFAERHPSLQITAGQVDVCEFSLLFNPLSTAVLTTRT